MWQGLNVASEAPLMFVCVLEGHPQHDFCATHLRPRLHLVGAKTVGSSALCSEQWGLALCYL
jgi:hypothetical protein